MRRDGQTIEQIIRQALADCEVEPYEDDDTWDSEPNNFTLAEILDVVQKVAIEAGVHPENLIEGWELAYPIPWAEVWAGEFTIPFNRFDHQTSGDSDATRESALFDELREAGFEVRDDNSWLQLPDAKPVPDAAGWMLGPAEVLSVQSEWDSASDWLELFAGICDDIVWAVYQGGEIRCRIESTSDRPSVAMWMSDHGWTEEP